VNKTLNEFKTRSHNTTQHIMMDRIDFSIWALIAVQLPSVCFGELRVFHDFNFNILPDPFFLRKEEDEECFVSIFDVHSHK